MIPGPEAQVSLKQDTGHTGQTRVHQIATLGARTWGASFTLGNRVPTPGLFHPREGSRLPSRSLSLAEVRLRLWGGPRGRWGAAWGEQCGPHKGRSLQWASVLMSSEDHEMGLFPQKKKTENKQINNREGI